VSCHSNQFRLQVAIARRRTRRVEGRTLQRGVIDGTPDDHGNKQNRQAGNAWHADCPHEGCQAVTTASEALRGVGVGLER